MTFTEVRELTAVLDALLERLDKSAQTAAQSRAVMETVRRLSPTEIGKARSQHDELQRQYAALSDMVVYMTGMDSVDEVRDAYIRLQKEIGNWGALKEETVELRVVLETVESAGLANVEDFDYDKKLTELHQKEALLKVAEARVYKQAEKFEVPETSSIEVVSPTLSRLS